MTVERSAYPAVLDPVVAEFALAHVSGLAYEIQRYASVTSSGSGYRSSGGGMAGNGIRAIRVSLSGEVLTPWASSFRVENCRKQPDGRELPDCFSKISRRLV